MLTLSKALVQQLRAAADQEIDNALTVGGGWVGAAPIGEVQAVAAIVSYGLPQAAQAWTKLLQPNYQAKIFGVFCHSTPQVNFHDGTGARRRCELADMLLVVDEWSGGQSLDRRAVLIQAKLASGSQLAIHGPALHQLDLYTRWPSFTFVSSAYTTGGNFGGAGSPGLKDESGRYGAIELLAPQRWDQIVPGPTMSATSNESLGAAMANMAAGIGGGREVNLGGADDWSKTVDELLRVTATATTSAALGSQPRGVATIAFQVAGATLQTHPGGPTPPPPATREDREDGPISVVYVRLERLGPVKAG